MIKIVRDGRAIPPCPFCNEIICKPRSGCKLKAKAIVKRVVKRAKDYNGTGGYMRITALGQGQPINLSKLDKVD